jgi:type IV secretory pathway VirB4 component
MAERQQAASLNDHINLYGFWNESAFLTKSGDLGMVLRVPGVDYETLQRRLKATSDPSRQISTRPQVSRISCMKERFSTPF